MNEPTKAKVFEYIKTNQNVTFAELEHFFEQTGTDYKGDFASYSGANDSVVFWIGWSAAAFSVLSELIEDGKIARKPCEVLNYLIDGKALTMPLATDNRHYKAPHWLPCCFVPCS